MGLPIEKEVVAFQGMGRHRRKKKPDIRLALDLMAAIDENLLFLPSRGRR